MKELPMLVKAGDHLDAEVDKINAKIELINKHQRATEPKTKDILLGILSGIPFGVLVSYIGGEGWIGAGIAVGSLAAFVFSFAYSGRI